MIPIRPWLYIGKYRETLDPALLSAAGIGAVLQLEAPVRLPGLSSLYLAVQDGEPLPELLLRQGVDFVLDQKEAGRTVLIACGAGKSRSVAFAVASLREAEDCSLLDAFRSIRREYPEAFPHPRLWSSLCEHYGEQARLHEMVRVALGKR